MRFRRKLALVGVLVFAASACGAPEDHGVDDEESAVRVETVGSAAREQYDANVALASAYRPTCTAPKSDRPRVLVTGFGRFRNIGDNASGRILSRLVPGAVYPETEAPPTDDVDPPGPQINVVSSVLELPQSGLVDVCSMILPVYWDLAAILIAKEMEAFKPTFVMMNGVAERPEMWIELGAGNRAGAIKDGSDLVRPDVSAGSALTELIEGGEDARPSRLSWRAVEAAARSRIQSHTTATKDSSRFGDELGEVKLAGFPRSSIYICNNVTYVTGYLMDHPRTTVDLLQASPPLAGKVNEVQVELKTDFRDTPRVFVHWPSGLTAQHLEAGADVMRAMLDAQLVAIATGDFPTLGDNALADPSLKGTAID